MKKKWIAALLSLALAVGTLGASVPAYATVSDTGEMTGKVSVLTADDAVPSRDYVEGEAIVCYKADTETSASEEKVKQEAEDTLEDESPVDEAEALLVVDDASAAVELREEEENPDAADDEETEEEEEKEALPGVITLVQSDHLSTEELIAELEARDDVIYAEPNYIFSAQSEDLTDKQWGEDTTYGIGADGWNTYSGDTPTPPVDTSEQVVAIMDTGVDYTHEDLKSVMWNKGLDYPELVAMGGGTYGYNSAWVNAQRDRYDTADPMDDAGHGTHCAGIVAAAWNKTGVSGVTSGAKIMAVKMSNEKGEFPEDSVVRGYQYLLAAKKAGVNIVAANNSYGGTVTTLTNCVMAEEAGKNGIVTVFSAGNDSKNLNISNSTSIYNGHPVNSIVVGASDVNGEIADFSNYGTRDVDVFAPGVDIMSTVPMGKGVPTETTSVLNINGQPCQVDYSIKDTVEDPSLGLGGDTMNLSLTVAGDGKKVLHVTPKDENDKEIVLSTKQFEDLSSCQGGYFAFYSDQPGGMTYSICERTSDGEENIIIEKDMDFYAGLSRIGFLYPDSEYLYEKKNVEIVLRLYIMDPEDKAVGVLDLREMRLHDMTENYESWSGTSMAAPMVTGSVAVLSAVFPQDSPAKLAARVTGSILPVDGLSDKCVSGGIFRLDKAIAEDTVPVPQKAALSGGTITVEGFFFGEQTGTLTLDGTACTVKTWSQEKITVEVPKGYKAGEHEISITSAKGTGHEYFRLGAATKLYPRLKLPGATISKEGDYQISASARKKFADFYNGSVRGMVGIGGYLYVLVEMLNTGTAVFSYKISTGAWEEICTRKEYTVTTGAAAWNGKVIFTAMNETGNRSAIGTFDPKAKTITWKKTKSEAWENNLRLVNNGYGLFLIGGQEGMYGNGKMVAGIPDIRRLDPTTMKITTIKESSVRINGLRPAVCVGKDGTLYSLPGDKIDSSVGMLFTIARFNGAVPKSADEINISDQLKDLTHGTLCSNNCVATEEGMLTFGMTINDETGKVVTDSYLISYDGKKVTKQSKILSERQVQGIVTAAYNGVCYVIAWTPNEEDKYLFAGIKANVIQPEGEKAYSNEWVDGIWYGKDGFRTMAHPYKASWKTTKNGVRYQDTKGNYLKKKWATIDGKRYYFKSTGIRAENEWLMGYKFNANGTCTHAYKYSWKTTSKGKRYQDTKGNYLKSKWAVINGKKYYFDANGIMASNEWVKGLWLGKNGTQTYKYKGSWRKNAKGWWYGDTSGWYAKSGTYKIDGKLYTFDSKGYLK